MQFTPESNETLTPMMRQYMDVKKSIPADAILLFRLGDFYEMFFDDALRASRLLDITLTKRHLVPMCGIPFHALDNYLPKLAQSNVKIAIADQVEDPKLAKGIVKREVTRIITPGTLVDSATLVPAQSNFLASVCLAKNKYGLAYLDVSTGNFKITELDSVEELSNELSRLQAKEILVSEAAFNEWKTQDTRIVSDTSVFWTYLEEDCFDLSSCESYLKAHFSVATLESFGCEGLVAAIPAAGAALNYAIENLKHDARYLNSIKYYNTRDFMLLDNATRRNLELLESTRGLKDGVLINVVDDTRTSMGARLLREWIVQPLYSKERINQRLESVSSLKDEALTLAELQETLCAVKDLERIIARINIGSSNARDLMALASSLEVLPGLKSILQSYSNVSLIEELNKQIKLFPEITELISKAILEEPPLTITEGGMIKDSYNTELDEFRSSSREGKNWIAALQAKEQERTGIKSLKIRFNNVFGYYIEITKSNLQSVPQDYIRKQTMVNAERFITPELKEVENKVLGADDKAKALEYEIFQQIREKCASYTKEIRETAQAIAAIDVLSSFAEVARKNDYRRPTITNDDTIKIVGGRHPVVESLLKDERFVSNDTLLNNRDNNIIIITGPNMAGKSTYIRQVALIVLMAQMGSFVPAEQAEIGIVDRIFTRVGASDDLAKGQSTFMVEMVETANILNNATSKSLVILDEIGRGTSTFDGLSIAWSVAEYIHNSPHARAKTLFATHYHELTELAMTCSGVKNYNVAVKEYGDKVIFLRQIIPGAADKSYGIYVAKLAGLPEKVISRAKEILENLENNAVKEGQPTLASHKGKSRKRQLLPNTLDQPELW
ncbi:MAG TPA: DNA mismatch repair protein MutS [Lentisphaeria bacterium]|nr:MAG: DNA mismatch repair protein MutS [Lentisphaerae bacterium GWF2_38_69]HBM16999.1 DNA mismatch repair protein MutS [Lentisphaeria bacterium]